MLLPHVILFVMNCSGFLDTSAGQVGSVSHFVLVAFTACMWMLCCSLSVFGNSRKKCNTISTTLSLILELTCSAFGFLID